MRSEDVARWPLAPGRFFLQLEKWRPNELDYIHSLVPLINWLNPQQVHTKGPCARRSNCDVDKIAWPASHRKAVAAADGT